MKNFGLIAAVLLSVCCMFSSCTEEEDVDIRDSYIGTYQGTETFTNSSTDYSYDVTLTIAKSEVSSDKIILTTTFFNDTQEIVQAVVKNGEFSAAFTSEIDGISKTVTISNGQLNGSTISYTFTAPGYVTITVNATKL